MVEGVLHLLILEPCNHLVVHDVGELLKRILPVTFVLPLLYRQAELLTFIEFQIIGLDVDGGFGREDVIDMKCFQPFDNDVLKDMDVELLDRIGAVSVVRPHIGELTFENHVHLQNGIARVVGKKDVVI